MADVLKEFLISIGFSDDRNLERQVKASAKRVEDIAKKSDAARTQAAAVQANERAKIALKEAGVLNANFVQIAAKRKELEDAELKAHRKTLDQHKKRQEALDTARKSSRLFVIDMVNLARTVVDVGERAGRAIIGVAAGMDNLYHASQRTKASEGNLKAFGYAASQLGSSVEGAANSLETLAQKMRASPGYESMLNQLGVNTRQNGGLRDMVDVVTDLGNAFAKMPHFQAVAYANALGLDERTMTALKSGDFKKRIAEYRQMVAQAGLNPEQAAKDSSEFMQTWRRMQNGLEIVSMRIEGALVKKFGGSVNKFTDWLLANSERISNAVVKIGEVFLQFVDRVAGLFTAFDKLSPAAKDALIKFGALAAALLLFKSGPLGALVAITGAILAFLDENTLRKLGEMWDKFDAIAKKLTGQDGLTVAFAAFAAVLALKVLAPLAGVAKLLGLLSVVSLPAWLAAMIGVGGGALLYQGAQSGKALAHGGVPDDRGTPHEGLPGVDSGGNPSGEGPWARAKRLWNRGKKALGFGGSDGSTSGMNAREPEGPGKYRPQYTLSEADLDQRVINTIGGEASTRNPEGIDAVINNMLNRVGSKGWGPSANLLQVARAPGQYAGYNPRLSAQQSESIRSRIRAIASGGVPDNTGGSNSFRAEGYYQGTKGRGRGYWAGRAKIGPNVGGNRYAYDPGAANGPYAPYATPKADAVMNSIPRFEGALENFANRLNKGAAGGLESLKGQPLGSWSTSSVSKVNNVTFNDHSNTNVSGVGDAKQIGKEVGSTKTRVHADLLRNLQSSVA